MRKHGHYFKSVKHLEFIDVYRVNELWEVEREPIRHAIKKLLNAGKRGAKDERKDYEEAVDSIRRALEMMDEDLAAEGKSETRPTTPDYTDGNWHEWHGGECPVNRDVEVAYELSDGYTDHQFAAHLKWTHDGGNSDIIRFRVVK